MEPKIDINGVATAPLVCSDRSARAFVWSVWFVMILIALACIARYGRNIPLAEDWLLVAPLTGNEPNILSWLWEQNNEHRIPLPRLLLLLLLKITNGDFRSGMVFNAITLGVLAIAMMQVARQIRGRTDFTDAFFPIVLLNMGHWPNIVWSWQIGFVLPTALTCGILLVIIAQPSLATLKAAIFTGVSLILLPLCGGNGVLCVPFLALWLSYCGFLHWKGKENSNHRRWIGGFMIGSAACSLCLVGLYLINYKRPDWNPPSPSLGDTLKTAAKFVAFGLGPAAVNSWELSVLVAFGILVPSFWIIVKGVLSHQSLERHRALGVLLFFTTLVVFALAMGWGRAGLVPTVGMPIRYVLLAVPMFCTAYFAWELYGSHQLRTVFQRGLLLGMCLLIPFNTMVGFEFRNWYVTGMQAIERDLSAGISCTLLAERHQKFLIHWWDAYWVGIHMQMLHDAGMGPFTQMQEDCPSYHSNSTL
jgi:hypothetical protein